MPRDFFDPSPEQQVVVLVEAVTLRKAERLIESCETCNPDGADIPFDSASYRQESERNQQLIAEAPKRPFPPSHPSAQPSFIHQMLATVELTPLEKLFSVGLIYLVLVELDRELS
jgi:hypothetical protein